MMPLLNLRAWLIPAIELNQAVVFYAPTGAALAYFSWAYLSKDDSRDFCMGRSRPFTQNQRLGGDDFWITDLAACDGALPMVIDYIKEHVASEVAVINFKARRRLGSLRYTRKAKKS
jgi:hemolysin-activating ACP:hemolysin acyltransferase